MANPFVGEIKLVPYNFAPLGWAECNGALLSIAENAALFSLIGTTYGGDGTTTFQLPDLRSRVAIHNDGQNLIGSKGGSESVVLNGNTIPAHSHGINGGSTLANDASPSNHYFATSPLALGNNYSAAAGPDVMAAAVHQTGSNQPHENRQPILTLKYIIALFGIFPSQN